jgi:hypothetical protein
MQLRDKMYGKSQRDRLLYFFTYTLINPSRDHILNGVVHALRHRTLTEPTALPSVALGKEGSAHSTSAKPSLRVLFIGHSTKWLPSTREHSAKKSSRYGDGWRRRSLCRVSQATLSKWVTFAECLHDSTGQRIRQRSPPVRYFAECLVWHSAKCASLSSARFITLGKKPISVPRSWFFAECYGPDTR